MCLLISQWQLNGIFQIDILNFEQLWICYGQCFLAQDSTDNSLCGLGSEKKQ